MNVIWIDEHSSSKQNGIGTYRDVLLPELAKKDNKIIMLSLNSDEEDFSIYEREFGIEIAFPYIANGQWINIGSIIIPVLHRYIEDSSTNVFMLNHSPCVNFVNAIKNFYPLSKIVFTIHDQSWCTTLLGDGALLHSIIYENKKINPGLANFVKHRKEDDCRLYNAVDRVVCLSKSTEQVLIKTYRIDPKKIQLIPNGYNKYEIESFNRIQIRNELGLSENDKIVLFVGRAAKYKGIEVLLKAIAILRNKINNIKCVFIGDISGYANYWHLVTPIATNAIFVGQIPHEQLQQWYAVADVGVMASYSEQCSYVALEMMASGMVIVSSDGNGLRDMFDERNAFIAHIESIENIESYASNLSSAIENALFCDERVRLEMQAENKRLLDTDYSIDRMVNNYESLINN